MHLEKLVTKPLVSFAKLLGKDGALNTHDNNRYHEDAIVAATHFPEVTNAPEKDVSNQINKQRLMQVKENGARLVRIPETVVFPGRQTNSFRGDRDDGLLINDKAEGSCVSNEENFGELSRFRMESGDITLKKHLSTASSRSMYASKTTQNELIKCCGDNNSSKIIKMAPNARFYSIIFEETTDISHESQLSLVLRYTFIHWDR